MSTRALTPIEARILAVLVEKQLTVPDSYPLSLNALALGCNQKTAREPVMNLSEAEVLQGLNGLKELSLVNEVSGSRVVRFEHNAARGLGVPSQAVALLSTLALRGAQTTAELRLHSERLYRFVDLSSVEGFLQELAERTPARVLKLPKAPGEREARWAHLLCGEPQVSNLPASPGQAAPGADADALAAQRIELAALKEEQARMAEEIAALRALVLKMASELGVDASGDAA